MNIMLFVKEPNSYNKKNSPNYMKGLITQLMISIIHLK